MHVLEPFQKCGTREDLYININLNVSLSVKLTLSTIFSTSPTHKVTLSNLSLKVSIHIVPVYQTSLNIVPRLLLPNRQ
jgi:hypothetical protein